MVGLLGFKATGLQGYRATGLQGYRAARLRDLLHVGLVQDISLWTTLLLPFVCVQRIRGQVEETLDAVPSHGQGFLTLVMGELDLELGVLIVTTMALLHDPGHVVLTLQYT